MVTIDDSEGDVVDLISIASDNPAGKKDEDARAIPQGPGLVQVEVPSIQSETFVMVAGISEVSSSSASAPSF